ncbi:SH3-like domain-containing protein [Phormidium sp. CLA17]|uniref:SH3 domain-containing protein n=1 Tax=Leptolyngbya sp. Cla-17 TaxID=2803751 RepID=UPI0018D81486|nr:SH3 domain-containing protein [Leptolyngbya sp. Cla-17]MBM0743003.1 SH3-like domain-containing protein [Leptolyngbya sp. Cla-17]
MKPLSVLIAAVAASFTTLAVALPSFARPATLVAQDAGSRINVRSAPTIASSRAHYGVAGDRVEVVRSMRGSDRSMWNYVQFSSGAKGWVRGDFVRYTEGMAEYGVLAGKTGDRINVRANPSTSATSPHYGLQGDVVQLLENKNTKDGYVWHFVQFPSGAQGWVRSDLISRMDVGC